jgi:hypothetical protein
MKMAFIVQNRFFAPRLMQLLTEAGIDYYTRWDEVKGKGHGTEPHLGRGSAPGTNSVFMIAFPEESRLASLIEKITVANVEINRDDDKIRLFQLPLENIV